MREALTIEEVQEVLENWGKYLDAADEKWLQLWDGVPYRAAKWSDAERVLGKYIPFSIIPRESSQWEVYIPGWDEIIHIRPERTLPAEEQIRRRVMRYDRIISSKQPLWARRVAEIMTFIDDVEDGLVTMAVIARLIAWKIPRYFRGIAGALFLASDLLNLFQVWRFFMPGGAEGKRAFEALEDMNPFGPRSKAARARRVARRLPKFGEWLEILQTTDNAFAVGISLGPILGFGQEWLFAAVDDVKWTWNPSWNLSAEAAASRMCAMMPAFIHADVYTEEEFMKIMVAAAYCHGVLNWRMNRLPEGSFAGAGHLWKGPPNVNQMNPHTRKILLDRGHDLTEFRFPLPGEPHEISYKEINFAHAELITENIKHYINNASRGEHSLFMGAMAVATIDHFLEAYAGPMYSSNLRMRRQAFLIGKILEAGVSPPTDAPLDEWERFLNMNRGFFAKFQRNMTVKDYRAWAPKFPRYWVHTYKMFWGLAAEKVEIIGKPPSDEYLAEVRDMLKIFPKELEKFDQYIHTGADINILIESQNLLWRKLSNLEPGRVIKIAGLEHIPLPSEETMKLIIALKLLPPIGKPIPQLRRRKNLLPPG